MYSTRLHLVQTSIVLTPSWFTQVPYESSYMYKACVCAMHLV